MLSLVVNKSNIIGGDSPCLRQFVATENPLKEPFVLTLWSCRKTA